MLASFLLFGETVFEAFVKKKTPSYARPSSTKTCAARGHTQDRAFLVVCMVIPSVLAIVYGVCRYTFCVSIPNFWILNGIVLALFCFNRIPTSSASGPRPMTALRVILRPPSAVARGRDSGLPQSWTSSRFASIRSGFDFSPGGNAVPRFERRPELGTWQAADEISVAFF